MLHVCSGIHSLLKCPFELVNVYVDLVVLTVRVLPVLHRPEVVDIGVDTI